MPNYKLSVSKDNKRYSIIFKADNEAIARERVHREWYSILGIEELKDQENVWNTFLFEAYKNWELKYWKIAWDDIFKVYVNLVKNLEYDVVHVYSEKDKWLSTEQKDKIVEELKEEYNLFFQKRRDKIDDLRDKIKKEKWEDINIDQFYMKKELEDVNKLIVHVLVKLESMILWNSIVELNLEQKQKLENIYNSIIKLKKSTNISKLREIWERALQKIWKLELEKLEETKDDKNRELLKETNKLLKELWSKDRFIEKDRDFWYQTKQFFDYLKSFFVKKKKIKQENVEIDKESHSYVKNQLYLSKYEEKLRENRIYTTKNFFKLLFNKELRKMNSLKRSVIKQNIFLLKSRLEWKTISYSFVSKWFLWIFSTINGMIDFLKKNLFYIIFIYIIVFLLLLNLTYTFWISFNYNISWVFLFLILLFAYIFISFSKNIFFVILNFALFVFIVILWVINF